MSLKENNFIKRVLSMTKNGEITWHKETPPSQLTSGTHEKIKGLFTAEIGERDFRIYQRSYKYFYDEFEYTWRDSLNLEQVFDDGDSGYIFSTTELVHELYDLIIERASNMDDFFDNFLNEDT